MLAHVTQQLRDRLDRAAALAALTAELEAAGTTVVDTAGYDGDGENVRVSSPNRSDGEPATEEDATPWPTPPPTTAGAPPSRW